MLRIVRGHGIAGQAKWACPSLMYEVHHAIRIQDGTAITCLAHHRLIFNKEEIVSGLQWGIQAA